MESTTGSGEQRGGALLRHSSIYLIANLLYALPPFLLMPVLTRYLSPSEYGIIGLYQMIVLMFGAVTGLNVHGAANRKYFDRDEGLDLPAYLGSCVHIILGSSAIVLGVTVMASDVLFQLTGVEPQWLILAVVVATATCCNELRLGQLQVRNRSLAYGCFQVALSVLGMSLCLALVVGLGAGLDGQLWGQSLPIIAFGASSLWLLRRAGLLDFGWRPHYIIDALRFGVPLIPQAGGILLLTLVDRFILKQLLGLDQIGIYIVAAQLGMGLAVIASAINKAYVPWLYRQLKEDNPGIQIRIVRATYLYFIAALLAAAAVALIAPWFIPWFAGPDYVAAAAVLGWLALGQAFNGMYLMVTNYIFYSQRTGLLATTTLCIAVAHIGWVYLLVQACGIVGAGIAFAISMATRFFLTWLISQRRHPMPWRAALMQGADQ